MDLGRLCSWIISPVVAALLSAAACAQPTWLSGPQIEQALSGRTIDGMYASGRRFTERYLESGALEYVENGILLTGRWFVTAGTLCTLYDTDPTGGCFRVMTSGSNCYEFYFVARSEEQARGPEPGTPSWTARGAIEGSPAACPDDASV